MKQEKAKLIISTKVMYICSIIIAVIAIASLVNNVILFRKTVEQYIAQGYPSSEVLKQLIPGQLLPGIFEPIAIYGGIALILFSAGIINYKLSKYLKPVDKINDDTVDTNNTTDTDTNIDTNEQTETVEEIDEEKH